MKKLGIDVGGSGMKGAVVDVESGQLVTQRYRIDTPDPATPKAMAKVFASIVQHFEWQGPIGCGMPGPIKHGELLMANNIDKAWIGLKADKLYADASGCPVTVINDADAAGLAEARFGAAKDFRGVVLLITLGTGIGSALFVDGALVPNTELGQIEVRGKIAERRASYSVFVKKKLTWKQWSKRVEEYVQAVEKILYPDLIIIGGGASKKADKFLPLISARAKIVPAQMQNEAGIVGAALCAQ